MENNANNGQAKKPLMIPTRILCLLLAIAIWCFVVNITTEEYEKTYVVSIKTDGMETLNGRGLSIYDISQTQISITVKGTREYLQNITESDFRAYIDVSSLEGGGKHSADVNVSIPADLVLVKTEPEKIDVYSDETATRVIGVSVELAGYSISGEYEIGTVTPASDTVSVTGPASVLDRIEEMGAIADLGNSWITGSFTSTAKLVPQDKNGTEVQSTFLTFSDSMTVDVTVNRTVSVPLSFSYAQGFDSSVIESVVITPASLNVKGTAEIAGKLEKLNVITIDGQTQAETPVSVQDITVPDGIKITDKTTAVMVKITYRAVETEPEPTGTTDPAETSSPVDSGAIPE